MRYRKTKTVKREREVKTFTLKCVEVTSLKPKPISKSWARVRKKRSVSQLSKLKGSRARTRKRSSRCLASDTIRHPFC